MVDYSTQAADLSAAMRRAYDNAAAKSFSARGELSEALDAIHPATAFDYSPEAVGYLDSVNRYLNDNPVGTALPGVDGFTPTWLNTNLNARDAQTGAPMPYTSDQLAKFAASGPLADQFNAVYTPTGADKSWDIGAIQIDPNAQYRLIDRASGNVVGSGKGYDAASSILSGANNLFSGAGNKANFVIQRSGADGKWSDAYTHDPETSGLGTFLKIALPLALGPLGIAGAPGVAGALGVGATTAGALGAGLGSALAGVANGDSLGDILKSAALSGGLSYAGGSLGSHLGGTSGAASGGSGAAGATGGAATGGGLAGALGDAGEIVVNGMRAALPAVGGAVGGALGSAITAPTTAAPSAPAAPDPQEIVVNAAKTSLPSAAAGAGSALGGALSGLSNPALPAPASDEIVVTANKPTDLSNVLGAGVPAAAGLAPAAFDTLPAATAPAAEGGTSTLDKIMGGAKLVSLLGALAGGSGGGANGAGTIPSGFSKNLSPTFNATLPAANMPGLAAGTGGVRAPDMTNRDWYRYGYGPEQSFFNQTPQARPNTSTAFTGYAEGGLAAAGRGGAPRAHHGVSDGRTDDVPAMLSDGEYVMDAETVAMLGNGSNEAGAKRLDQFRVNIRKHKGAKLAKGAISAHAKTPERYLAGGLT